MCANEQDYSLMLTDLVSDGKGGYAVTKTFEKDGFTLPFPFCTSRITAIQARGADYVQLRRDKANGDLIAGTLPESSSDISIHMAGIDSLHFTVSGSDFGADPRLFVNFTALKEPK